MGLFDRLFGGGAHKNQQPDVAFGRFTDAYKSDVQYKAWDQALARFEAEDHLGACQALLGYLRDDAQNNVTWEMDGPTIRFTLYQGSKKISGHANAEKIEAEAKVAHASTLSVAFMRRLIEQNFSLKYSRFALDDNDNIVVCFSSYTLDGSPYKLYYALKEVAVNADKQDDLLVDEFDMLEPVEIGNVRDIPEAEKVVKYEYLTASIRQVFAEIDSGKLNPEQFPGGIAYLLLSLTYKLDFLTKPEGYMMEVLEGIHRTYFTNDGRTNLQKISTVRKELQKLLDRPREMIFKELYRVTSTFGVTTPVNQEQVAGFIAGELPNIDWYKDNNHEAVAMSIAGYIAGYCLFNYAVPKPTRELFYAYFQIVEQDYFRKLGFTLDYADESGRLNAKNIKHAILEIVENYKDEFPRLKADTSQLRFDTRPEFAKSYMLMLQGMDMSKPE